MIKRAAHDGSTMTREQEREIRDLVETFYERVREDELLGPVFEERIGDRWAAHLDTMCDFWSSVLHATGRFRGDPIASHARIPGLDRAHFDRWMELFTRAARDVLPTERAEDVVARGSRIRAVLEHRCVGPRGATPTSTRDRTSDRRSTR